MGMVYIDVYMELRSRPKGAEGDLLLDLARGNIEVGEPSGDQSWFEPNTIPDAEWAWAYVGLNPTGANDFVDGR